MDETQQVFRHDADGFGDERSEFDDDVVFGKQRLDRAGAADAPGGLGCGVDVRGEDLHLGAEGFQQADQFARHHAEAMDADAPAEERGGLGAAVLPPLLEVHGERPTRGAPQAAQHMEERPFRDDATDGAAPVREQQALLQLGARHQLLHRAAEIAHVTEAGWQRVGEGARLPGGHDDLGIELTQQQICLGCIQGERVLVTEAAAEGAEFRPHGLGEEVADFLGGEQG